MFISVRFFLLVFLSVLVAEAASQDAAVGPDPAKQENAKGEPAKGDYVLQPQDLIKVQVFQEDEINHLGEVRISQEFTVILPLIGSVDLKNKTARMAQELIRKLYDRDYLVNPQVTVIVMEYQKRYVNVLGAVNTPAPVIFPPEKGLTLIEAINWAGGFARIADKKHVTLKRTNADGKTEASVINADELMKGRTDDSWPLQPGDVIFVPEILF
jgi:polysaccharide export outer membrane protein